MTITQLITAPVANGSTQKWSLANLFRALVCTRRKIRRIAFLAERQRLELGFQHVPQRVWERRSALFIDR